MKRASLLVRDTLPPPQPAGVASWYTPGLSDGLGDRLLMFDNTTASSLELLRFRPELAAREGFEAALRARVTQLSRFAHPSIAVVRKVEWLGEQDGLALVSNHTPGRRLSDVIDKAVGPSFALELIRQLVPALASLERQGANIAHGAITPERIVVTPDGQLVLTEHVMGSALEALHLSPAELRSLVGVVLPPGGTVRLDGRTDVIQLAFMALSMLVGRRLPPEDYPSDSAELLDELVGAHRRNETAALRLRFWLERALQLGDRAFGSARDADAALGELPGESELLMAQPRRAVNTFTTAGELTKARDMSAVTAIDAPGDETPLLTERPAPLALAPPPFADRLQAPVAQPAAVKTAGWRRWAFAAVSTVAVIEGVAIAALLVARPLPVAPLAANKPATQTLTTPAPTSTGVPAPGSTATPAGASPATSATPAPPPAAGLVTSGRGRLEITTDVPGARVTVDGATRGQAPLTIDLEPGPHVVVLYDRQNTVTRTVNVAAGTSSTLMATMGAAGIAAGWLSLTSPLELQILENGALIGTTSTSRLMLPAGKHDLVVSNAAFGFQTSLSTEIKLGKTTTATVAIPNGSLSLNALPWANVWVDGKALGTTPVANLDVPLGTHEVIWRHPQLGERRQSAAVTAKAPVRLVMDLTK